MTLEDYIASVKDDIETLEKEDTSLYGCCDMAEHNLYLEMNETVLSNLLLIQEELS